jgi:putative transposase
MRKFTVPTVPLPTVASLSLAGSLPLAPSATAGDLLMQKLREGAVKMLTEAIEAEVADYLAQRAHLRDPSGKQQVVRNGYLPQRSIQTPLGDVPVQQPRVRDRRAACGGQEKFTSQLLPPYLRRTKSMEELIPWLYLKGISTGDMQEALAALLGPQAAGLSATTITRLKSTWEEEHRQWAKRSLEGKHYVYVWVDGVHFNVRLEDPNNARQCILVMIGATAEGKKELIAIQDGYRESYQSWKELLLDVQSRGLATPPNLAIGDGSLGFWKALEEVWPQTLAQRCWVHKTANVLSKMPKSVGAKAKSMLQDIWLAPSKAQALTALDLFVATFSAKYPGAVECLTKDRDRLFTFYGFPAEHWRHLRTTNPIESMFGTVRLRTDKTKGCGSRGACLAMVFKLAQSAQKNWRTLNGYESIPDVIAGVVFADGVKQQAA